MTIEEIIECDAAMLEAMDDVTLRKHFEQYFPTTRPELAPRPVKASVGSFNKPTLSPAQVKAQQLAKSLGIDLPLFSNKLGRKI